MRAAERVIRDLRATAGVCGPLKTSPPALRWGPLLGALDESIDEEYLSAIELIYEGYLLHYRESRVGAASGGPEMSLLAGDVFYARGLHLIAARGDAAAVDLLARLMASCSCLRSMEEPFSEDDALWAYAVGALVALRRGAEAAAVTALFDQLDEALAAGAALHVRVLARAGARDLGLPVSAPLDAELARSDSPVAAHASSAVAG